MADISKLNIENVEYNIKDLTARNPEWNSYDPETPLPYSGEYIGTSIKKLTDKVSEIDEDFATKNELNNAVETLQGNFQAGVDTVANACIGMGSAPEEPYTPEHIRDAIYAIQTGSNLIEKTITTNGVYDPQDDDADGYSLVTVTTATNENTSIFPQEIPSRILQEGGCITSNITLENNIEIFYGHINALENNSINIKCCGYIQTDSLSDGLTTNFSLVIDNTTTISNIGSITFRNSDPDFVEFSLSYSLENSLTPGYHTISLIPISNSYSYPILLWPMFNIYGNNFNAVTYPGGYLYNSNFIQFIPNNFIIPTNPTEYRLSTGGGCGCCGAGAEDIVEAMNNHFTSSFDSGISYNMKSITPYWDGDEYIYPSEITDTLLYNNGKFTYSHLNSRSFSDTIYEEHYFILPVKGDIFKFCPYINIHVKMINTELSGSGTEYGSGYLKVLVLKRTDLEAVAFSNNSSIYSEYIDLSNYGYHYDYYDNQGDEFIVSLNASDVDNSDINFIAISFYQVDTNSDKFALEIDKIWGTNTSIGDNDH